MGRHRKFITQKQAKMIAKKPYLGFYSYGAFGLIMGILFVGWNQSAWTIFLLVSGILSIVIGIAINSYMNFNDIATSDYTPTTPLINPNLLNTTTQAQKPEYDFFTENTVIDADYLQRLIDAQRKIKLPESPGYDGLEVERIVKVEFNPTSRMAKVTYEVKKYYKTIERYVQQNYQRYPVSLQILA